MKRHFLPILPVALVISSCSPSGPGEITETRPLFEDEQEVILDASNKDRFRFAAQMMPAGAQDGTEAPAVAGEAAPAGAPGVQFDQPEGWTEAPGSAMRDLNFTFGENGEGEVYLARLGGTGGGLAPNVNRWRSQMGLEDLTEAEISALPQLALFGLPATYLDMTGDFAGMGGGEGKANYGMLGVILSTPQGALFVKATAPRPVIDAEKANFETFVASLRFERP